MTDKNSESFKLINSLNFCVFDLETTGGNHNSDKIIEIGVVKVRNLEITQERNYLIDPEIPIPEFIQKLTSIKPTDLVGKPKIEDVIEEILEFMGEDILVAHNSSFDVPFFNSVLKRLKRPELKNRSICTNLMTKYLIPEIMNSNLNYMSRIFDIEHDKAHRALEDAKATAELLIKFLNFFIAKNVKKVNQLYYPRNKFELDRIHFKNEESPEQIIERIQAVNTPLFISIKGEQGLQISCLPIENFQKDKEFLKQTLLENPYTSVTVQMVGSFIEAFMRFNEQVNKMSEETRESILGHLFKRHLGLTEDIPTSLDDEQVIMGKLDFLLSPHLIPEQFIAYPISNLFRKSEMVFRYPGHKKKFIQYINSQTKKMPKEKGKYMRGIINKELFVFFNLFLKKQYDDKNKMYYFFNRDFSRKKPLAVHSLTEAFFKSNSRTYNYPKEHI